jgi:TetR/AcrR family transcriptional repressor of nem operon
MRYAKTRKAETRQRVVETASRALRRDGIDGIGLVGLMGEAGLTKGGFYAHFGSKDDLVAEAVATSLQASAERMRDAGRAAAADGRRGLHAIVDAYLSEAHAAAPEAGCTIGALLSDLSRAKTPVREAAIDGAAALTAAIEEALPVSLGGNRRSRARALLGLLTGGLQLARLETDPQAREAVLSSAREAATLLAEATSIAIESPAA